MEKSVWLLTLGACGDLNKNLLVNPKSPTGKGSTSTILEGKSDLKNSSVIDWLLEEDQPTVRYYTLVDILDRKENLLGAKTFLDGLNFSVGLNLSRPTGAGAVLLSL